MIAIQVDESFASKEQHVVPTGQIQASPFVDARAQSLRAIPPQPNTPTLQYSTTPRSRIRGQPARRSLPEFQTTGRSREDDDENDGPGEANRTP
jgi:hypothetical protein